MNIGRIFKSAIRSVKDHSGTICAVTAMAGVVATAILSGKAAVRVDHEIDCDMTKKERAKVYARCYWKTAAVGAATCGLIFGSDRIHVRKEVGLAGLAALWKGKYVDLDKATLETVGEEKYKEIQKTVIENKIKENPNIPDKPSNATDDTILVYEPYTDQYIWTTREQIWYALYEANLRLQKDGDVKLSVIIDYLGGEWDPMGDMIGWNYDNEVQAEAWSYYDGGIELLSDVYRRVEDKGEPIPTSYVKKGDQVSPGDAVCLFYTVDPETQTPEDMIYFDNDK